MAQRSESRPLVSFPRRHSLPHLLVCRVERSAPSCLARQANDSMSDTSKLAAVILWILACSLLSVWTWTQFLQWIAEDVKCP